MDKEKEKSLSDIVAGIEKGYDELREQNDKMQKQIEKTGKADSLTAERVDAVNKKLDELTSAKEKIEKMEERQAQLEKIAARTPQSGADADDMVKKAAEFGLHVASANDRRHPEEVTEEEYKAYKSAFERFMRKNDDAPEIAKALSVGSDPDGGYVVDPDTSGRIVTKVYESSPMRQYASVQTIGTDALEGLLDLDEAGAGWVGETQPRNETDTPQFRKWRIPVHEMYAQPSATQKVLDDSNIDVNQWLSDKVSARFSRKENEAFVKGDGQGKPRGFLTYPDGTDLNGTIEQIATGVSGGFAGGGAGADVVFQVIGALKDEYRAGSRFFMPRSAVTVIRTLKDSEGRYIWVPGLSANTPDVLAGYPIARLEDMPEIAANSRSIAFGNMAETYQIVDRVGVRVLRDPYTNKPFVKFYTTKRVGGDVLNFESLKLVRFGTA